MYLITIMLCSLVLALIHLTVNCHPFAKDIKLPVKKIKNAPLLASVTINEDDNNFNSVAIDYINFVDDNIEARESPETSQEPNQSYQKLFDFGSSYSYMDSDEAQPECILARSEFYLSWWVHDNGSLRMPAVNRLNSSGILDLALQFDSENSIFSHVLSFTSENPNEVIRFMSIAQNHLEQIPASVLNLTSTTIQYLSLAGNDFHDTFEQENTTFQNFTAFPLMGNLLELDLRSCHIKSLTYGYFDNLPKLDKLFLSHNKFVVITAAALVPLKMLRHLDISYNELPVEVMTRVDGMILGEAIFTHLDHLMFLDLSHSLLSRRTLRAMKSLGHEMEQLSLCYTNITHFERDMLANTSLKVIDLSGNKELYDNLTPDDFKNQLDLLEIFVFRDGNLKDAQLVESMKKLRMLDMRNNSMTNLTSKNFAALPDLEILDLGSNHIDNWYERVFSQNDKLRIVNLRTNNITSMRDGMLLDFYQIRYLAIGSNDFICACNLRDFIDRATRNALYHYCSERSKRSLDDNDTIALNWNRPEHQYNVFLREFHMLVSYYEESYRNMLSNKFLPLNMEAHNNRQKNLGIQTFDEKDCYNFDSDESTHMNFNFLLLDYTENEYKCIDESYGKDYNHRRVQFNEIQSCFSDEIDSTEPYDGSSDDESNEESTYSDEEDSTTTVEPVKSSTPPKDEDSSDEIYQPLMDAFQYVYLYVLFIIPISLIIALWYWKRADIKYFFALFRNSLILSLDKDDKKTLMMTNRKKSTNSVAGDQFTYDVFVSYSEKDRSWVLDELIPNIEKRAEINICLHERDFQVGLSILENIIQCMDKSRCLLLVVSESFIKSNWCAFEMHLAQHRLIETRREQLILVLLQDIPRSRRTRTLQFLMRTKTYIMWPTDDNEDSRSTFWKRLKKAIVLNNWEPENKATKPRHSIV